MVTAILSGAKTQTRRKIKSSTGFYNIHMTKDGTPYEVEEADEDGRGTDKLISPKVEIGDIMWVRETWQITDFLHPSDDNYGYIYKASDNGMEWASNHDDWKWKPSIFMPKEACRIFLKVTRVRIERLVDISISDIVQEGIPKGFDLAHRFRDLWTSINGPESWNDKVWVFVYDFEVTDRPEGFINNSL